MFSEQTQYVPHHVFSSWTLYFPPESHVFQADSVYSTPRVFLLDPVFSTQTSCFPPPRVFYKPQGYDPIPATSFPGLPFEKHREQDFFPRLFAVNQSEALSSLV